MRTKRRNICRFILCTIICVWLFSFFISIEIHLSNTAKNFIDSQTDQRNNLKTEGKNFFVEKQHKSHGKKLPKGLREFSKRFLGLMTDDEGAESFRSISLPPVLRSFEHYYNTNKGINHTDVLQCGQRRKGRGYLTIGIPTVRRRFNNYLYLNLTLHSLIGNLEEGMKKQVVVVIFMADNDTSWNMRTSSNVCSDFRPHFESGLFQMISAPHNIYPDLSLLKNTSIDSVERVKWRTKQNFDFALLMLYSKPLNKYYIQLEDDLQIAPNFMSEIQKFVTKQRRKWVLLEFSKLGFIGKFFHSKDLLAIAVGLLENLSYLPCDLMLGGLRILMGQHLPLHTNSSLFQHIGKISTLKNKMMPSVDKTFKGFGSGIVPIIPMPKGVKPPARFDTNMDTIPGYFPENVYKNNSHYWAKEVKKKQYFRIMFTKSLNITRLLISTGSEFNKSDILLNGALKVGAGKNRQHGCEDLHKIADFVDGEIDTLIQGSVLPININCIHIEVKRRQKFWLIIRNIEIFLK